jgi:diguanylate cyclase (GGDEF)-like protein
MGDKQNGLSLTDTAERLRIEQLDMLARLFQVMVFAGLNTLAFLFWVFSSNALTIGWVAPLGALVMVYGMVLVIGYSWRCQHDPHTRAEASVDHMNYYVGIVLLLGLLWATLLFGLNSVVVGDQRSILYATTIGVISAAAVLQPVHVALAFWAPVTLGASCMLAQAGRFIDLQIFGLLLGYSPLVLFTSLFINRTLVRRVTHEARLQDQADVIGLLLRDFEANSSHWLWETDSELRLRNVSPRFADIAQMPAELLANRSIFELLRVQTLLAGAAIPGPVVQQLQARSAFANIVVPVDVAGQPRWWSLTGRPTFDRFNTFIGFRGVGADVTEATQDARRTAYLASYDSLTGLANRVVFQRALEEACADALQSRSAVLYLDLDGFKQVNDTLGHATGDALLFAVAQRIRNCVREGDLAARLGGDEFAILMQGATEQAAALLAQRVLDGVSHPIFLEGHKVEVSVSVGIALSMPGLPSAALLDNADRALYQAKTGGRGIYRLFSRSPAHEQHGDRG